MSETRRCDNCLHWIETRCRANPPTAMADGSSVFPIMAPEEWCSRFSPTKKSVGQAPKVSDARIIQLLGEATTDPMPLPGGGLSPPVAIRRADFVNRLMEEGMTRTPALKRIAKLVRQGRINQGENPWPNEASETGIHVWGLTGGAVPTPQSQPVSSEAVTDRSTLFLFHIRRVAPPGQPMSMRKLVAGCGLDISVPTGARWLKKLIQQGQVADTGNGYCAEPTEFEAPSGNENK